MKLKFKLFKKNVTFYSYIYLSYNTIFYNIFVIYKVKKIMEVFAISERKRRRDNAQLW